MRRLREITLLAGGLLLLMGPAPASAQNAPTRDDIVAYCRGVNLDANRLKECLSRNQDVTSPQCKATYLQALDAIQKRIAARVTVANACSREIVKICHGSTKETSKSVPCLMTASGVSRNCTAAMVDAGYK